jgi:hypothetical protein
MAQMTEKEKMLMRAAQLQQQAQQMPQVNPAPQGSGMMSPATIGGTTSPYVDGAANRDFDGRQAMIAQQLRQGNDNLMAEAPQGKQMGDVYVAPTWSENLAGAAQKMIGGYQMGQARKAGNQLGEDREETAQAVGLQKAMERKKAEQQLMVENDAALRREGREEAKIEQSAARDAQAIAEADQKQTNRGELTAYEKAQLKIKEDTLSQDRDLAIMKLAEKLDPTANMTTAEKTRINKEAGTFSNLSAAINSAEKLQSEGGEIGGWKDVPIEKVTKWFGEGAGNLLANSDSLGYTPAEMAVRGSIDGSVEQYRRAFTGANLTQIEKFLGANWDPTATGIGTQEKIDRSRRLLDVLNNNRAVFNLDALEVPAPYQGSAPDPSAPVEPTQSITTPDEEEEYQAWVRAQGN